MERHFVATTFIVKDGKTLLHKHRKLGFWLPVGGHVDENETPQDAALREVREECGLDVELYDREALKYLDNHTVKFLMKPMHLTLEVIEPGHEHMDFVFYAKAKDDKINPGNGESSEMGWFTADEVDGMDTPADVKVLAREAIDIFK